MNGRYRVIDEVNFNVLGTFDSCEAAVNFVAALLSVNVEDYLDELTIANDQGERLTGDSLRNALVNRVAHEQVVEQRGEVIAATGARANKHQM